MTDIRKQFIDMKMIEKDPFYQMIKRMPKGALLHAHFPATTNMVKFLMKIKNEKPEVYRHIYYLNDQQKALDDLERAKQKITGILNDGGKFWNDCKTFMFPSDVGRFGNVRYSLAVFTADPPGGSIGGWKRLADETEEAAKDIISKGTRMQNLDDYNFDGLERITNSYWSLIKDSLIFEDFFRFTLQEAFDDGLQAIELKTRFGSFFRKIALTVDGETYYRGNWYSDEELDILLKVTNEMKGDIYCKLIMGQHKGLKNADKSKDYSLSGIRGLCNNEKINKSTELKDLVKGIDIFGDEDPSNQNRYFINVLLDECDFNYYPHAGETDKKTKNYNLTSLISLTEGKDGQKGKKVRVGHGIALARDKALVEAYKQVHIHIEICPLSNYILGYINDLSVHPGIQLFNADVRMSINSDDASIYGYDYVSVDWYYVIRAWDLNIDQILKLCIYSIQDSSLSPEEQKIAFGKFKVNFDAWRKLVDSPYSNGGKGSFEAEKNISIFENKVHKHRSLKRESSLELSHIPEAMTLNLSRQPSNVSNSEQPKKLFDKYSDELRQQEMDGLNEDKSTIRGYLLPNLRSLSPKLGITRQPRILPEPPTLPRPDVKASYSGGGYKYKYLKYKLKCNNVN